MAARAVGLAISKKKLVGDDGSRAHGSRSKSHLLNPFITALFVLFAFGAILYGWGSNTSGHCEVII